MSIFDFFSLLDFFFFFLFLSELEELPSPPESEGEGDESEGDGVRFLRFLSFFFFSSFSPFDEGAASEGTCDLSEPALVPVEILLDPGAGGTDGAAAAAAELDFSDSDTLFHAQVC